MIVLDISAFLWYVCYVDRKKTVKLERLINESISRHTAFVGQTKDAVLVHFELTIKFRTDEELDAAITLFECKK